MPCTGRDSIPGLGCPTWILPRPSFATGVPPGRSQARELEESHDHVHLLSQNVPLGMSALPEPRIGPSEVLPCGSSLSSSLKGPANRGCL